ncbi:unnamed protein product [Pylaiella littoralis]
MATLADSFLDDLDELGESSDDETTPHEGEGGGAGGARGEDAKGDDAMETDEVPTGRRRDKAPDDKSAVGGGGGGAGAGAGAAAGGDSNKGEGGARGGGVGGGGLGVESVLGRLGDRTVDSVAKLRKSDRFKNQMADIDECLKREPARRAGALEDDPEYKLVVASNELIQDIDPEMVEVHRFVVDRYSQKFPELDSLIPQPADFIRTVQVMKNEMDMTQVELESALPQTTVMVVSVTGSTTSGQPLTEEDLQECLKGCEEYEALVAAKASILGFVETRMTNMAPNVCNLIGSRITARLLALTGGLTAMSKTPSCNLQVMGQEKKTLSGFSSKATVSHAGLLYQSDVVQDAPPYLRTKALRVIAAKVSLASRFDSYGNDPSGHIGRQWRAEVEDKIEKWQELQTAKTKKALPKPDDMPARKRGGKRVRSFKQKFAMTDVRKEANRMGFASMADEYSDTAMGLDFGMLGKSGSGRVRAPIKKEAKQNVSKKLKVANLSSGQTNGLNSSLVFTPIQGLELVNPNADKEKKVMAANKKWFDSSSGFMSAKPK